MARRIYTDGRSEYVRPAYGKHFTLTELREFVGNGPIEPIRLPSGDTMLIHEEGKFLGLPVNGMATTMARAAGIAPEDFIVGDVVVLGNDEWD